MIYLLCTNCPRYGWDQRRLWRQPRLKPDVTNWLPNESHMSHLSIIYLSYENHLGLIRLCHRASLPYTCEMQDHHAFQPWLADVTMTRSKRSMTLRMRGAAACLDL